MPWLQTQNARAQQAAAQLTHALVIAQQQLSAVVCAAAEEGIVQTAAIASKLQATLQHAARSKSSQHQQAVALAIVTALVVAMVCSMVTLGIMSRAMARILLPAVRRGGFRSAATSRPASQTGQASEQVSTAAARVHIWCCLLWLLLVHLAS